MSQVLFNAIERGHGIPLGFLNATWGQESAYGTNMFNPESGAKGHFQIIPQNYLSAGIDPMDLVASANWTARNAAAGIAKFPHLPPLVAAAAHHFAGSDVSGWGPKTRQYVSDILRRVGNPMPNPLIPDMNAPTGIGSTSGTGVLDVAPPAPMLGDYAAPPQNPLTTPAFWFDAAAGMDLRQAPMAALATGLSNAYSRADERRAAFERSMLERQEQAQGLAAARQKAIQAAAQERYERAIEQRKLGMQEQRLTMDQALARARLGEIRRGPALPSNIQSILKLEEILKNDPSPEMLQALNMQFGRFGMTSEITKVGDMEVLRVTNQFGDTQDIPLPKKWADYSLQAALQTPEAKAADEYAREQLQGKYTGAKEARDLATRGQNELVEGMDTGSGSAFGGLFKRIIGASDEELGRKEFFRGQVAQYIAQRIAEGKGDTSDFEQKYYRETSPGEHLTEEGNYLMMELYRRAAVRSIDRKRKWNEFRDDKILNGEIARIEDFDDWYYNSGEPDGDPFPQWNPAEIIQEFRDRRARFEAGGGSNREGYRPPGLMED